MKTYLLILSVALFASCSTAYKSGQTPDDLYYAKPKEVLVEKNEVEQTAENFEEKQIRMAINNRRWRNLDYNYDYDYRYNPYSYGYNYGYYYNPCYYPYPVFSNTVVFANPKNTTIRKANLGGYSNTVTTFQNVKVAPQSATKTIRKYNNTNVDYTPRNNTYNNDNRNYTPSSNNGNSGSSTPAPAGTTVTRPSRGG
jgi:hypothetical protein